MPKPRVVVGIPTFKRPVGLRRLLESLAKLEGDVNPHILVVDNEGPNGQGLKVVQELQQTGYRWPITGVAEPERGISQARNKLLSEGFGILKADFLAMVDDDERVEPRWLAELLAMQAQTGADVVGSWVRPEFPDGEPAWAQAISHYYRAKHPAGPIRMIYGTGGTLLKKNLIKLLKEPKFNLDFGLTGGEDEEFFQRAKRAGASFAFEPNSVVWEIFDAGRITPKWALRRSYRIAQGNYRTSLKLGLYFSQILKTSMYLGYGLVMLGMVWHPRYRMVAPINLAKFCGKISAIFRTYYFEYK